MGLPSPVFYSILFGMHIFRFYLISTFNCENCKDGKCYFSLWKDDYFFVSKKKTLSANTVKTLLSKGKVKINGFHSEKADKKYDAVISFIDRKDKNGTIKIGYEMSFDNATKK